MKKLLSVLLFFALLFSSVSASFASGGGIDEVFMQDG